MKKRVFAMLMAAVMAFSLVACGSKSDNGGSGDASGTETIKLGGVGPLTGGYANYGLSVQHGAELAVKEINAAGGVNGKQLELSFQDSQGDPESAVAAYGKLMDWGMNISLGAVLSGETASVVAAAKADDVLVMGRPLAPPTSASTATTRRSVSASTIPIRAPRQQTTSPTTPWPPK